MNIAFFGLGSLGATTLVTFVKRMMGEQEKEYVLHLFDNDTITRENVVNQPWYLPQVGKLKVNVAAAYIYHISGKYSETYSRRITSIEDIPKLKFDVAICTFDNNASRSIIYEWGKRNRVNVLQAAFNVEGYYFGRWNAIYRNIETPERICHRNELIFLIQHGGALAAESLYKYINTGEMKSSVYK